MKRKGVITLFIRSYLRALNCLAHFRKVALCLYDLFENILKCQCKANFVIILVSVLMNVYKVFLKICVLKVQCENVFVYEKGCEQAFKSSYPIKSFLLFSFSFGDSTIHTISWQVILSIGCEGTGVGSSYGHLRQHVRILQHLYQRDCYHFACRVIEGTRSFCRQLEGTRSFFEGNLRDIYGL